jgi:hypothetical protein
MVALTKTERRIYFALSQRPCTAEELREIVWAHDPNGGPESRNAIFVHLGNLNKRLAAVDQLVRIEREDSRYRLTETPRNLPAHKLDSDGLYPG